MLILDGKAQAAIIRAELAVTARSFASSGLRQPGLAVILVGDNPASKVYVAGKQRACAEIGIRSFLHALPPDTSAEALLDLIARLNAAEEIDGILLQLPLPVGIDSRLCLDAISPDKDVDGFHPVNVGRLALGLTCFAPCTPAGVMELLRRYDLSVAGGNAVVAGRSDIVGTPLAVMLSRKAANATVTLCHSATRDLGAVCRRADFLFTALGKPGIITADMVKTGAVVVDIGITRTPSGLKGDVDYAQVAPRTSAITPVPGGVGPMTIAMLMRNTLEAYSRRLALI